VAFWGGAVEHESFNAVASLVVLRKRNS